MCRSTRRWRSAVDLLEEDLVTWWEAIVRRRNPQGDRGESSRRGRRAEAELDAELRDHLDRLEQDWTRDGMSEKDARRRARARFGNLQKIKDECRDVRPSRWLETTWQDVTYGFRLVRRRPVFAATIIISLALAIGANAAIFSLLDAIVFARLPVANPDELVVLASRSTGRTRLRFSYPVIERLGERTPAFSGVFTYQTYQLVLGGNGTPDRVRAALVSGEYFSTLGVPAALGRTIGARDNVQGAVGEVAVLSERLWRERFAGDPQAIGSVIRLNNHPVSIIGVMPRRFAGVQVGQTDDIWLPIRLMNRLALPGGMLDNPDAIFLPAMARIRSRLSTARAGAEAAVAYRQIRSELYRNPPNTTDDTLLVLLPGAHGQSSLQQSFAWPLTVLMAIVGLFLLAGCMNVATLLLAQMGSRRREMAVRLAVGAPRVRLLRQLFTEATILSLAGGAVGLIAAPVVGNFLAALLPDARGLELAINIRVLGFVCGTSLLTTILFGVAPAIQFTKPNLAPTLKDETSGPTEARRRFGLQRILLISQIAMSLVLMVGAALFARTLIALQESGGGYHDAGVVQLTLNPRDAGYAPENSRTFYRDYLLRVQTLPGVRSAAYVGQAIFAGGVGRMDVYPPGYQPRPGEDVNSVFETVSPGFFETLGIPVIRGRDFSDQDTDHSVKVAIINETMARDFFGTSDPIGRYIGEAGRPDVQIVGVVGSTKYRNLRTDAPRIVYYPFDQLAYVGSRTLYARTSENLTMLMTAARRVVQEIDPAIPVYDVRTFRAQVDESLAQERLAAWIASASGLLAVVLVAVGLFGAISYSVARRMRELGVRLALGARPSAVLGLVLGDTAILIGAGVALGVAIASLGTRLIASLLYGLSPHDATSFAVATLVIVVVTLAAGYLPARRAASLDPLTVLRSE